MKNLIKLLAIIAMITVSASNVCAQTTKVYTPSTLIQDTIEKIIVPLDLNNNDSFITSIIVSSNTSSPYTITFYINSVSIKSENITVKNQTVDLNKLIKANDTLIFQTNIPKYAEFNFVINIVQKSKTVGLNNNLLAAELNLYSYDNMVVLENKATPKPLSVNIYNLSGQLVVTENVDGLSSRNEISTTLPNGIYMVHVSDGVNTMVKKLYISK